MFYFGLARISTLKAAEPAQASPLPGVTGTAWVSDNGNGTYSNPLFYEEFEDPDVIRVGKDYYLAGTTMHMNPGVILMHSLDLVNWELAGYCTDKLDLGPAYRLEHGQNIYGRGIWAPCIRYHDGMFFVLSNVNGAGLQVFRSRSIQGPWEHNQLPFRHDMSVLFDDDLKKIFIISGNRNPYPIEEIAPDLKSILPGVQHHLQVPPGQQMGEGHHLYKIKGTYYDISAMPGGTVNQMVARANSIDGPWTVTTMVQAESLGVPSSTPVRTRPDDRGLWLHQGGMVDTPSGEWWSIIMQDHGSIGRMVSLVPITWDDGFPLIGLPGNLRKAPITWVKPDTGVVHDPKPAFLHDDTFAGPGLNPLWQWNHVEDDSKWSLTEKPGVLRLHSLPAADFYTARNSLCQRPPGPVSIMTVELNGEGLSIGDHAGLALLSTPYAGISLVKTSDGLQLQRFGGAAPSHRRRGGFDRLGTDADQRPSLTTAAVEMAHAYVWLRVVCDFETDKAVFSWSADGRDFASLGEPFTMTFQLITFQGVRPALFNFNTAGQAGGYADFKNFRVDLPRPAAGERSIPLGKTIILINDSDGTLVSADSEHHTLVSTFADQADAVKTRFKVIDMGLGRVALMAADGKYVSTDHENAILKDLGELKLGLAETFQWVNLLRGDVVLMSLTNHRYLTAIPGTSGPLTVTSTGPTPARKSGAEFNWKTID